MSFDELNTLTVRKETKTVFDTVDDFNRNSFKALADWADQFTIENIILFDFGEWKTPKDFGRKIEKKVLESYNPVTEYKYAPELERKRLRMAEGLMTAKTLSDREMYNRIVEKNAQLLYTQSQQYAEDVTDTAMLESMKRAGVKKVRWIAEKDDRTCSECRDLDGMVFPIDAVPKKPHYRCRCRKVPYIDKPL